MSDDSKTLEAIGLAPGLTVDDLAASMRFYEGLGFGIDERWENEDGTLRGVMIRAGNARLGLSQDDWAKGRDREKGIGMRLWIETSQDVDEVAARAQEAGITLDSEPQDMPWGGRAFSVVDPDGFPITISRRG